jgi:hypothetical protein
MKLDKYRITIQLMLILVVTSIGCRRESVNPIEQERQELLEFMRGEWEAKEVRKDNVLISDFDNLIIKFDELSLTSSNGQEVWPDEGTLVVTDVQLANGFMITGGIEFLVERQDQDLRIDLSYQQAASRLGIEGDYEFVLSKIE